MISDETANEALATQEIAHWAANLRIEDVSAEVYDKAKECLLDWAGAALAGSTQVISQLVSPVVDEAGCSTRESTILRPELERTSCLWASFLNGFNSHILEIDDVHRGAVFHPGAVVIPAALALGERCHIGGMELLLAIIVGYEVSIRIGQAAGERHYAIWHTTGTCGTFGSAVAAGKILRLDETEMSWALGNAGTQASGLWQFLLDGSMTKPLHPGKAAFNGVLSALMAKRGFTGPRHILEGAKGFLAATSSGYEREALTSGLGNEYRILEVSIKPYPSCRHSHPQIDAALEIARRPGFDYRTVRKVTVRTYQTAIDIAGGETEYPSNPHEAKFNSPYCVAVALARKKIGLRDFEPDVIAESADVRGLMGKVGLEVGREFQDEYPKKWGAGIEVQTEDGGAMSASVSYPKGDPENPLSLDELKDKALDLAGVALDPRVAVSLVERLLNVSDIEDVSLIFSGLSNG